MFCISLSSLLKKKKILYLNNIFLFFLKVEKPMFKSLGLTCKKIKENVGMGKQEITRQYICVTRVKCSLLRFLICNLYCGS